MRSGSIMIPLSLLAGLILVMIPLPAVIEPMRPDWVTMIALYWAFALPQRFGLIMAWLVGLLLDVSQGTLLGQHAMAIVVVVFIAMRMHLQVRMAPILQQALTVMILLSIKQGLVLWTSGMAGTAPEGLWLYFSAPLVGMLLWPLVFVVLRDLRQRYRIA